MNRTSRKKKKLQRKLQLLDGGQVAPLWSNRQFFEENFIVGDDGQIFGRDDEQTFNGLVEEFHDYLSTHGHAPGSDVIPGSRSAATAVESAFKTSARFRRKHGID